MKKLFLIIILSIIIFQIYGENIQSEIFDKAVTHYKNREFEDALDKFKQIENQGILNSELLVNIGNCYFRIDQLGMSILYYKKALKISPNYEKAVRNFEYATSLSIDAQQEDDIDFFSKLLKNIYKSLSVNFLAYLSLFIFLFIAFLINFLIFKYRGKEKTFQYFILIILILFFTVSFSLALNKWQDLASNNEAVLIADSAIGYSGPGSDFTRVFTIHEGNVFKIIRSQDSWTLIQLDSGLGGWINNNFFKTIDIK